VLRSKTPELVQQEFFGLLMAHYAIRGLMHEAALRADEDPDRLSFLIPCAWSGDEWPAQALFPPQKRNAMPAALLNEILEERVVSSRNRINPRGVKRKMSNYTLRPRKRQRTRRIDFTKRVKIVKRTVLRLSGPHTSIPALQGLRQGCP
jgi:hypothetical protein